MSNCCGDILCVIVSNGRVILVKMTLVVVVDLMATLTVMVGMITVMMGSVIVRIVMVGL